MSALIGRETELDVLHDFVSCIPDGAPVLLLDGEVGVGKTTLWEACVAEADGQGYRVLAARPAESEAALSFAGLNDLLETVLEETLPSLPEVQRRALWRAFVLDDDDGSSSDPYAVGVAFLNVLRRLGGVRPCLIAVDDVQWFDRPSLSALLYAARRLKNEPVGLLLARRLPLRSALLEELVRSLAERVTHLDVEPVEPLDLQRIVRKNLGIALPRPLLADLYEMSGGNPFYALEIARTLRPSGRPEAGRSLSVPKALHDLVNDRLLALPAESRDFLLAAAAHPQPTIALTSSASGIDHRVGLTPALESGIVDVERGRIRFTHPLLASAAYETADPVRRDEVHARLAELLDDPEARAWQLAAFVEEPDEAVAQILEDGARRARARGAPQSGAALLDRAQELTPSEDSDDGLRRAVEAAYLHFESGDAPRAEMCLQSLIAPLSAGRPRARAMMALARMRTYDGASRGDRPLFQVLDEAEGDQEILAPAHEGIASSLLWQLERLEDAAQHAQTAFTLARELGDEELAADAMISELLTEALLGRNTAAAAAERALMLDASASQRRLMDQPLIGVTEYWIWTDQHERSRELLLEGLRRTHERGDESSRPYLLFLLAEVEGLLGDLKGALSSALEGQEAAEESGQPLFVAHNLAFQGLAHAQLGNPEPARDAARRALELIPEKGGNARLVALSALGHLELVEGSPALAVAALQAAVDFAREESIAEPGAIRFVVDLVEALTSLAELGRARVYLDWYEENAKRLGRVSALASSARCRGLLAAADGRVAEAVAAFSEALEWHQMVDCPLERARTLLALGMSHRRLKRRREARATLDEALAIFERVGATLWAERARAELRRISGRAPTASALTPAEERVAALVAQGKSNRDVAATLFVSERTVDGHLSHIFRKLGHPTSCRDRGRTRDPSNTGIARVKDGG